MLCYRLQCFNDYVVGLGFVSLFSIRNDHVKGHHTKKQEGPGKRPLTFINEAKGTDSGRAAVFKPWRPSARLALGETSTLVSKESGNFHTVY